LEAYLKQLASGPSRKETGILESKLNLAAIELKAAQLTLAHCTLHAPISGTVLRLRSVTGDAIDARGTMAAIGDIADLSKMQVIARLPFGSLARWKPGATCSVQIVGDETTAREHRRRGTVTRLAPVVDAKTDTVTVYIAVTPADEKSFWRPGSPVSVKLLED
jgi:multidrug resistance efflux pump